MLIPLSLLLSCLCGWQVESAVRLLQELHPAGDAVWDYVCLQEQRLRGLLAAAQQQHQRRHTQLQRRERERRDEEKLWRELQREGRDAVRERRRTHRETRAVDRPQAYTEGEQSAVTSLRAANRCGNGMNAHHTVLSKLQSKILSHSCAHGTLP